jgi:hypothetical protein
MLPWVYTYVGSVLFQMFHLFQTHVASVLSRCCITHMLQVFHLSLLHMFYTYVASVLSQCCICFAMATHVFFWCCKCFNCFERMLQVFSSRCYKSRSVLHMLQWDPYVAAVCWTRMHTRGCGGARAAGVGNSVGADRDTTPASAHAGMGNGAARESER